MYLRIQYHNEKYDYVPDFKLDSYLHSNLVKRFFRPSERRWVLLGADPVRGFGGSYMGPDRRRSAIVSGSQSVTVGAPV